MCKVGRRDREGRERSEKVSGGGVGKVVGGESIIDPSRSIFNFPISEVVLRPFNQPRSRPLQPSPGSVPQRGASRKRSNSQCRAAGVVP